MAKQIIVTQNDYGIELETQFVDDKKKPLDITDYDVRVKIIYDDKTIDTVLADHKDSVNGIAYIVLEKEHLINAGLHTTVWSVLDEDEHVTAQENVYYFVKDVEGSEDDTPTTDFPIVADDIINKFKEVDDNLLKLTEHSEIVSEQLDNIATIIDFVKKDNETWDNAINRLIEKEKKIKFLNHEYELYNTIILRDNTIMELHDETILTRKHTNNMFQTYYTKDTTGYGGVNNISIKGGTLNHNGELSYHITMSLFHAKNINIKNVTFKDISNHAIDLIGCYNIDIDNCIFKGQKVKSGKEYKEAIQIDTAYSGATGYEGIDASSACYDGTSTKKVRIHNCEFTKSENNPNVLNAIGQHAQVNTDNKSSDIKIYNNTFNGNGRKDIYGNGIKLVQMENVVIRDNIFNNYNRAIQVSIVPNIYDLNGDNLNINNCSNLVGCEDIKIINNTINMPLITSPSKPIFVQTSSSLDQNVFRHKNIVIENNTINNKSDTESIYIGTLSFGKVLNNIINGGTKGIYINDNNENVVTFNNTIENVSETEIEIINEYKNGNGRCELSFNKSVVIKNIDFANGITNYSSSQYITYSKNNGTVTLEGACTHTPYINDDILLFTLPIGYRPLQDQSFITIASGKGSFNRILVKKNGQVILQYTNSSGSTPFTCVGGISFLT